MNNDKPLTDSFDIKRLGRILSVGAHPDDESFSCAGIMAAAVQNGQFVACMTATRGEAGVQDESRWPASQLGAIRTKEMEAALAILGIGEHCWLDYPDGGCADVSLDEAAGQVADCIRRYRPDSILTFGPDGMTGHPDHQAVSRWVDAAVRRAESSATVYHAVELREDYERLQQADKRFNIFFNISQPPLVDAKECAICFRLPEPLRQLKYQALRAMPSQTEGLLSYLEQGRAQDLFAYETFVQTTSNR